MTDLWDPITIGRMRIAQRITDYPVSTHIDEEAS